jgi:hypothetical protein
MNWEQLARAETHPLRVSILEVLTIDRGRTLSPVELEVELQSTLSNINYHATLLYKAGLLRLVHRRQVRGATEHFYCHVDHSGQDLFERLPKKTESDSAG